MHVTALSQYQQTSFVNNPTLSFSKVEMSRLVFQTDQNWSSAFWCMYHIIPNKRTGCYEMAQDDS